MTPPEVATWPSRWRAAWPVAAAILLGLLAVVAVAAVGVAGATGEIYPARADDAPPVPARADDAPPVHRAGRPTAVVVLGPAGANAADVLAPYEVLADTVEDWLRQQRADGDPLLVSVCTGAEVLAAAGLLDGRPATSHWLGLIGLRRDYPQVRWRDGVRFVDDGDVITTAGVLSGVDGVLRVIERTSGQDAAGRAARTVNWPDYSPGGALPRSSGRGRHRPMWWGCSARASGGTGRTRASCSPRASGRSSWPRRSGPTPSWPIWLTRSR